MQKYELGDRENKDFHNTYLFSAKNKAWRTANTQSQPCLHTRGMPKATA